MSFHSTYRYCFIYRIYRYDVYSSIIYYSVCFPIADLVKLVEKTVRSEYERSPNRPIYLVGESLGGCLALAVAARNHDIDLVLILANPGTFVVMYIYDLIAFILLFKIS